jgi:plasmid stabilization system protein ParE
MAGYVFTAQADNDLDGIIEYTRRQWGDAQARRYLTKMRLCLDRIADERGRYRIETGFSRPVRVLRCQHHYIFCLPRDGGPALILAILHERMDLLTRITERLK